MVPRVALPRIIASPRMEMFHVPIRADYRCGASRTTRVRDDLRCRDAAEGGREVQVRRFPALGAARREDRSRHHRAAARLRPQRHRPRQRPPMASARGEARRGLARHALPVEGLQGLVRPGQRFGAGVLARASPLRDREPAPGIGDGAVGALGPLRRRAMGVPHDQPPPATRGRGVGAFAGADGVRREGARGAHRLQLRREREDRAVRERSQELAGRVHDIPAEGRGVGGSPSTPRVRTIAATRVRSRCDSSTRCSPHVFRRTA